MTLSLVNNKKIDLIKAISLITINPIKNIKIRCWKNRKKKKEADLCIFSTSKPWKVNPEKFHGKSKNSPFDGMLVEGKNLMTFVRGRLVYEL